ncbi:MAG: TonB-dependent receptor [Saprospiraceae bacterium]|nr:TonB-dependent receptor [Saprospiraceae bacterium]
MKKILLLMLLLSPWVGLWSQNILQGTVTDHEATPLPGATVLVKNTIQGTVTDANGAFSLALPPGDQTLVINYIGYGSREVMVREGMRSVEIMLEAGVILGETVVTALGVTRDEKSLGYATSQIKGKDLTNVREPNIINQLAGRAAGVTVIGSSGNLGSSARITIRGLRSISGENQPLFVVDGVPMDNSNFTNPVQVSGGYTPREISQYDYGSAIQDLNPEDIENISVLKGQAAAALYGSRGANGVIMVTTKKGKSTPSGVGGRRGIGVSVNSSLTFETVLLLPDYQNKYGGGVDLIPHGYTDGSGYYNIPYVQLKEGGDTVAVFASFDLVPIYAVDESSGIRFATTSEQHLQHLAGIPVDTFGNFQYNFYNGFGQNQFNLYFRDWNSWDAWDTEHYGQSRLWEASPNNPKDFYETGITSSQNIALDGGGDHSAFRLSYNRMDQKGVYPNSHMERNTLGFNGSLDMGSSLTANIGVNYVNTRTLGRSATGGDGDRGLNPSQNFSQWWHRHLRFEDLKSYINPDGTQRTWNRRSADDPAPNFWNNPYWNRYKNYQNDGRDRFFGNAGLRWKINSWLSASGRVLQDYYNDFREERTAVGSSSPSQYALDVYNFSETNTDLMLRAERDLTQNLAFSAFVGGNRLGRTTKRQYASTRGGLNVADIYTIQNSKERPVIETSTFNKQINSFFGGATFGWKNMLYLDLTGRQDWSSTLPVDNNGYFYPSASLSYVFSEMINIPKMSFGKLRLGWAKVGNDTDPYAIYATYKPGGNFGSSPAFTVPDILNNSTLKPEETSTVEAGADLRFFKNRFRLDLTVYSGKTINQIIPLATTPTVGYTQRYINAGVISNKGLEIQLGASPVRLKNFSWDIGINFGKNVNKLVDLDPNDPALRNIHLGGVLHAYEGEPYGTILGPNFLFDKNGNKLLDTMGHYLVSTQVMPLGNISPDFTGGITNNFAWKGLSLNVFIDFRKGGDIVSYTNGTGKYTGLLAITAEDGIRENGVVEPGVVAELDNQDQPILESGGDTPSPLDDIYKSTGESNTKNIFWHDRFAANNLLVTNIFDGSYIKLRELSLGYTLPQSWLKRVRIQDMQLAIVGRNLAILFKNIPNVDPDNAYSTNNIQGNEGGAVPSVRSVGVNLSFRF